jgi:hypothetical protein
VNVGEIGLGCLYDVSPFRRVSKLLWIRRLAQLTIRDRRGDQSSALFETGLEGSGDGRGRNVR